MTPDVDLARPGTLHRNKSDARLVVESPLRRALIVG